MVFQTVCSVEWGNDTLDLNPIVYWYNSALNYAILTFDTEFKVNQIPVISLFELVPR